MVFQIEIYTFLKYKKDRYKALIALHPYLLYFLPLILCKEENILKAAFFIIFI